MSDYSAKEGCKTTEEYVSEREQMATVLDIILCVKEAEAEGKTEYTSGEIVDFLYSFIGEKTRHTGEGKMGFCGKR